MKPNHAFLTLPPNHSTWIVHLINAFIILCLVVTPNETIIAVQTIHCCRSHYHHVNLHFCHKSPLKLALNHSACTLFFISPLHSPLLRMAEPRYFRSPIFTISTPPMFHPSPSHSHTCILFYFNWFSFFFSLAHTSTDSLLSLQIPVSSANIFVDIDSCLTSLVKPSITIADKELRADPRCSFYHTPITVSLSSQMSCISLHLDVRISFPWMIERTSRQSYLLSKPSW